MKFGMRKPSLKKKLKAKTTGKVKRQLKKSIDPTYGKKGAGMIKDPKKAVYNKVYNETTEGVDLDDNSANSSAAGCGMVVFGLIISYLFLRFIGIF